MSPPGGRRPEAAGPGTVQVRTNLIGTAALRPEGNVGMAAPRAHP